MKSRFLYLILIIYYFISGCSNKSSDFIELSGIIESTDININSKVSGEIKNIYFNEGDKVNINDTLALIDQETYILQKKQSEALLSLNEAQYNLMINGYRIEDIKQAEENMKSLKTNLDLAEYDKINMEKLYNLGSISEKQWKDVLTRYLSIKSQFSAAEENYLKLKRGSRKEDILAAKAKVDQAKAQLELIDKQLRDTYIISPISGIITNKVFEKGEMVQFGSTLFTISQLDKVYLMVYINESDLGKIKYGQKADIFVDSYPDKAFQGKIIYISSKAEFTPKNIQTKEDRIEQVFGIKIEIDNKDYVLKPGMPADAKIIL